MRINLRVGIIIGLALLSCKKEPVNTIEISTGLIGKWSWIRSCGGYAGECNTPETTGFNIEIQFRSDSTYEYVRDDTFRLYSRFHIIKAKSLFSRDSADIIIYENRIRQSFLIRSEDTLLLNDECYDCYSSLYKRIK